MGQIFSFISERFSRNVETSVAPEAQPDNRAAPENASHSVAMSIKARGKRKQVRSL